MAVVVNEFEVVPQPAQPSPARPAAGAAPEAPRPPLAEEIERTLWMLRDRELRLRAD